MAIRCAVDTHSAFEKELKQRRERAEHREIDKRMRIEARFGQLVRMHRKQRHFTQIMLADKCDLNQNYISDIECGKRNVTLRVVDIIAKALGIGPEDLIK